MSTLFSPLSLRDLVLPNRIVVSPMCQYMAQKVGLITGARQAEEIVASGQADLVALARAMLYDPRRPWHAAAELGASVDAPPPYWRAAPGEYGRIFNNTRFGAR